MQNFQGNEDENDFYPNGLDEMNFGHGYHHPFGNNNLESNQISYIDRNIQLVQNRIIQTSNLYKEIQDFQDSQLLLEKQNQILKEEIIKKNAEIKVLNEECTLEQKRANERTKALNQTLQSATSNIAQTEESQQQSNKSSVEQELKEALEKAEIEINSQNQTIEEFQQRIKALTDENNSLNLKNQLNEQIQTDNQHNPPQIENVDKNDVILRAVNQLKAHVTEVTKASELYVNQIKNSSLQNNVSQKDVAQSKNLIQKFNEYSTSMKQSKEKIDGIFENISSLKSDFQSIKQTSTNSSEEFSKIREEIAKISESLKSFQEQQDFEELLPKIIGSFSKQRAIQEQESNLQLQNTIENSFKMINAEYINNVKEIQNLITDSKQEIKAEKIEEQPVAPPQKSVQNKIENDKIKTQPESDHVEIKQRVQSEKSQKEGDTSLKIKDLEQQFRIKKQDPAEPSVVLNITSPQNKSDKTSEDVAQKIKSKLQPVVNSNSLVFENPEVKQQEQKKVSVDKTKASSEIKINDKQQNQQQKNHSIEEIFEDQKLNDHNFTIGKMKKIQIDPKPLSASQDNDKTKFEVEEAGDKNSLNPNSFAASLVIQGQFQNMNPAYDNKFLEIQKELAPNVPTPSPPVQLNLENNLGFNFSIADMKKSIDKVIFSSKIIDSKVSSNEKLIGILRDLFILSSNDVRDMQNYASENTQKIIQLIDQIKINQFDHIVSKSLHDECSLHSHVFKLIIISQSVLYHIANYKLEEPKNDFNHFKDFFIAAITNLLMLLVNQQERADGNQHTFNLFMKCLDLYDFQVSLLDKNISLTILQPIYEIIYEKDVFLDIVKIILNVSLGKCHEIIQIMRSQYFPKLKIKFQNPEINHLFLLLVSFYSIRQKLSFSGEIKAQRYSLEEFKVIEFDETSSIEDIEQFTHFLQLHTFYLIENQDEIVKVDPNQQIKFQFLVQLVRFICQLFQKEKLCSVMLDRLDTQILSMNDCFSIRTQFLFDQSKQSPNFGDIYTQPFMQDVMRRFDAKICQIEPEMQITYSNQDFFNAFSSLFTIYPFQIPLVYQNHFKGYLLNQKFNQSAQQFSTYQLVQNLISLVKEFTINVPEIILKQIIEDTLMTQRVN